MSEEKHTIFQSTTGGVMTVEVGAIIGRLEVRTKKTEDGVAATIRYAEARDWYTVEGSPVQDREDCHERVVERLTTPGRKEGFNEEPTTLLGLSE